MTLALAFNAPRAPELRPYQLAAIEAVEARFAAGERATLVVLPTGTGKTVLFAELARRRVTAGHRALVLAHRTELLTQARAKLEAVGVHAAIEQGPQRAGQADVVVASVQTLRGPRLATWSPGAFDVVIIDEAHHATATTYRAIVDHFAGARILGVTATPDRADGQGLGPIFQSVAYSYDLGAAIRDGYLAPIRARRVKLEVDLDKVKTTAGDLNQGQLGAAMTDPAVIEATARALLDTVGARRTVLFSVTVAHAALLVDALNLHRPGCARWVSGESADDEREAAARDLSTGRVQIVANAALWTEGFDCPAIEAVAIARPTKSRGLFTQMVGRGTRLHPGKADCLVVDFAGLTSKHRLVSTVDVLAGDAPEAELVRERAEREDVDVEAALADARREIERARHAPTLRWVAEDVADLLGVEIDPRLLATGFDLATDWQRQQLEDKGLKPPAGLTELAATKILDEIKNRQRRGLATIKMVRFLGRCGVPHELGTTLTFGRAGELIGQLKPHLGRWTLKTEAARVVAELRIAATDADRGHA